MRRYLILLLVILSLATTAWGQVKGATEVGGSVFFQSFSEDDKRNFGQLTLFTWLGYYISRRIGFDLEPGLNINISPDSAGVSGMLLGSFRLRLFDMTPSGYRKMDYLTKDYGISSSVFLNLGIGYWSASYSLTEGPGDKRSGPAIMAGVGTQSNFGRFSTLRTKLQWVEMFPSPDSNTKGRSLVMLGLGFGVFIR